MIIYIVISNYGVIQVLCIIFIIINSYSTDEEIKQGKYNNLYKIDEFLMLSEKFDIFFYIDIWYLIYICDAELKKIEETIFPQSCCEIVYTAGCVGEPIGVMLSHDNITWTARQYSTCVKNSLFSKDQRTVVVSPLFNISIQILQVFIPIMYYFYYY